jgi:hypothetical protein
MLGELVGERGGCKKGATQPILFNSTLVPHVTDFRVCRGFHPVEVVGYWVGGNYGVVEEVDGW